jgi:hypothetical protein
MIFEGGEDKTSCLGAKPSILTLLQVIWPIYLVVSFKITSVNLRYSLSDELVARKAGT